MLKTSLTKTKDSSTNGLDKQPHLYAVCRRGNDSYSAVQLLHEKGFHSATLDGNAVGIEASKYEPATRTIQLPSKHKSAFENSNFGLVSIDDKIEHKGDRP